MSDVLYATGCVKFFLPHFNYGYIVRDDQTDDQKDIFFHVESLDQSWDGLPNPNESVSVEYRESDREPGGWQATSVTKIDEEERVFGGSMAKVEPGLTSPTATGPLAYVKVMVKCPACSYESIHKAGVLGKKMRCISCSKPFTVPGQWK